MCHSHRSSPLTSAQTFVFPKEYIYLTQPHTRRLDVHHPARRVLGLSSDQISTAMRHAPCGIQAIASLNRARWGDNVYIPVHKGRLSPEQYPGKSSPNYWAKSDTYSNAPVSNRAHNTTNGILRFLMTCRAADFNNLDLHHRRSPGLHPAPAGSHPGTYQFLTVTQHGYRHVITLKNAAFIREIAIKPLPLHTRTNHKPISNVCLNDLVL